MFGTKNSQSLGADFNRVWSAGLITNLADGILKLAAPLLAITLTHDPVLISLLSALSLLPWLFFAIPIGGLVDRVDRGRALVFGNAIRASIAILLSFIIYRNLVTIWILLAAVFFIGICEVLVDTTSQSVTPVLVDRNQLERANSRLQISEVLISQFVGTPLSGFLYAAAISLPFFFSGAGFIIAAFILVIIPFHVSLRPGQESGERRRGSFKEEILFGLKFMYDDKRIFHIVVITTLVGFFYSMSTAIAPLFIVKELGVEPRYLGILFSIQGIGALFGSVLAPRASKKYGRGRALAVNLLLASIPVLLIGLVPNVWYFIPLTIAIGVSISIWNILLMSLYQSLIPQELFGRIHGARRTVVWGLMPLGSVAGGFVATQGLRLPFIVGGMVALIIIAISFKRIIVIGDESAAIVND